MREGLPLPFFFAHFCAAVETATASFTFCMHFVHGQLCAYLEEPSLHALHYGAAHTFSHPQRPKRCSLSSPSASVLRFRLPSGGRMQTYGGTFAAGLPFPICFMIPLAVHQSMKHYAPAAPGAPVDACLHRPVRRMVSLARNLCCLPWPLLLHLASACASEDSQNKLTGPLTRAIASAGALKDSQNNAWLPLLGPYPPSVLDARPACMGQSTWSTCAPGMHLHLLRGVSSCVSPCKCVVAMQP